MPNNPKIKPEIEPVPRINPFEPIPPDIKPNPEIGEPAPKFPETEPLPLPEIEPSK